MSVKQSNCVREGNEKQIRKKGVGSVASRFTFLCSVARYMSIIRLRLPSIPSCSFSHWPPHPSYYQFYCHQPSHSSLFFPLTEKAEKQKGLVFSALCWLILMAQSHYPNNTAKRLYPEHVLACSLRLPEKRGCTSSHIKCVSVNESTFLIVLICPVHSKCMFYNWLKNIFFSLNNLCAYWEMLSIVRA